MQTCNDNKLDLVSIDFLYTERVKVSTWKPHELTLHENEVTKTVLS